MSRLVKRVDKYELLSAYELNNIKTIVILGWGLIGDLLIRVPTIEALAERHPDAHICVVTDPAAEVVVRTNPHVDQVIVANRKKRPAFGYLKNMARALFRIRRMKPDLVLNLYAGGSSVRFSRLCNARYILGVDHTRELRRINNILVEKPSFCSHWSQEFGKLLAPLGIDYRSVHAGTAFYPPEDAVRYARSVIGDAPVVALNLGAGAPEKRWPVSHFVELANYIRERYGFHVMVFTNPGMEELAQSFAAQCPWATVLPTVGLAEVGAIMSQCKMVVTGDTSLMHIAFGVRAPTVALFTYTRPEWHVDASCETEVCFIEGRDEVHETCGVYMGNPAIPLQTVCEAIDRLISRLPQ